MRIASMAILALLSSCSGDHRKAAPVDIDRAAVDAQADIDAYAARREADERRALAASRDRR